MQITEIIPPYVVGTEGKTLTGDDPAEYQTIQAAIDAAVAGAVNPPATNNSKQLIFIKPGVYVENLTLNSGVTLYTDTLGTVNIVGSHTINSNTNDFFFFENLTFLQNDGNLFVINSPNTGAPSTVSINIIYFKCQLFHNNTAFQAIVVNCLDTNDRVSMSAINSGFQGPPGGVQPPNQSLISTGPGRFVLDFNSGSCGGNFWMEIDSEGGAGNNHIFVGNVIRFFSSNIPETYITCTPTAVNTYGLVKSCCITNDSSMNNAEGFLNVQGGIWNITGCSIQNPNVLNVDGVASPGNVELWSCGFSRTTLRLIIC